jgi:ABC-type glycerol-3-phosphate transport system substrate-binding protein
MFAVILCTLGVCGKAASAKEGKKKGSDQVNTIYEVIPSPMNGIEAKSAEPDGLVMDDMGGDSINYGNPAAANGQYYVLYTSMYDDDRSSICIFDEDGKNQRTIELEEGDNDQVSCMSVSPDGRIFLAVNRYDEKDDKSVWEAVCLDKKGKAAWKKALKADDSYYIRGMASTKEQTFLLSDTDIRIIDNAGKSVKKIGIPIKEFYGNICTDGKNQVILAGSSGDGFTAWKYDPKEGKFVKTKMSVKGLFGSEIIASGAGGYDFFTSREDGVYGMKLDSSTPVKVLDYIGSNLSISYLQGCAVASSKSMFLISFGVDDENSAALMRQSDSSAASKKIRLRLGCSGADPDFRKTIVDFNKSSDKIHIDLVEYPYDESGISKFSSEIAKGNIPDLMFISPEMPVESYVSKGLFEDIEPLFRKDPVISKNKYLNNVLDSYRIGGKMYFVTPSFNVCGMMGKAKEFKGTKGLTIKQLQNMIKKKKADYKVAMGVVNREMILTWVMYYAMDTFVDWDKGTCSFNSDEFIDILGFAKKFPRDINYEQLDWEKYDAAVRSGDQLVREVFYYDFSSYMVERYGYFGEDVLYMGYPGDGRNGPAIQDGMTLAMSHDTKHKNECWEFMRSFYLDEYQDNIQTGFPVSIKALKAKADKSMHPETYTYVDENGKQVEEVIDNPELTLNGKSIKIPTPQQTDIDTVMETLKSLNCHARVDYNISNIVQEEAGAYFSGQKSAKETADIIQSRVKVYILESK